MGYSTDFSGSLKFACDMTAPMLAMVNQFFDEDPRSHPEWNAPRDVGYIDLKLTKDFSGIEWSGSEKTYGMVGAVNIIIEQMRKEFPQFALSGSLLAQGEDIDDRWELHINDEGKAVKVATPPPGTRVKCPHCERSFHVIAGN